ncbi:MAG: hypothetical protein NTV94_19370 [Planctomycetota bacterium]|nr:hypothetical protein [Planctomycetota bacterium]
MSPRDMMSGMRVWIDDAARDVDQGAIRSLLASKWSRRTAESAAVRRAWAAATPITTRWFALPFYVLLSAWCLFMAIKAQRTTGAYWALVAPVMCLATGLFWIWRGHFSSDRELPSESWIRRWKKSMLASGHCPSCAYLLRRSEGETQATCSECGHTWSWVADEAAPIFRDDHRAALRFGQWCHRLIGR